MTRRLFIDTWGWVSLGNRRESRHEDALRYYRQVRENGGEVHTTDYVLDETVTMFFRRLPGNVALERYERITAARKRGFLRIHWVNPQRFAQTVQMRRQYSDKPDISFTDLSSMVVMQELEIEDVLTGDAHFEHVGLGFRRRP
jgi:predicted nucleic acid-binding protein